MDKKTEALKLALECIEAWDRGGNASDYWRDRFDAITAIREALAEQPAQQQELPACISCGAAPTRYVDEDTELPGTYCDNCGPGGVPAQQQEPVCDKDPQGCWSVRCQLGKVCKNTSPQPSKPWVGLTDEDIRQCSKNVADQGPEDCVDRFAYAIEAKLREKNA